MNIIRNIKGTHDILPAETKKWQSLENIVRKSSELFGFEEIRTPIFEQTKLFSRSVGSDSDIVSKEMYSWDDRDGTSLTLRPELTASIARSFIQNNLKAISPLNKLYYLGPLFRRERPQKGRQRQFHQFGVEALGSEFPEMDAEIISIAWTIILKCQLSGSTSLQLNSIGSKECREGYRDALKNFVRPYLKEFSETSQKRFSENVLRLLDTKSDKEQIILNDAPKISKYYTKDDKKHFEKVKELLQTLRIPFSINSKLVRGLDYYSRTVFEFTSSSLGAQNAILGGGRYDNLIKDLGGKETPGIGFAAGMERFLIAMKDEYNNSHIDIYVACILEDGLQKSLSISNELRNLGLRVTSDTLRRSLKSQMRDANKLKSKYIIIIGEEELESETFIVKDLDKGNQKTLSKSEVIELLKNVII
ncbi:MAG: histidine--tRNA ligase [Candidatus Marinimicrobia bacterium]|jgi:histidyl-tRNA synthetase|nr:histidine--tRNA ligase [Candidatus Neomarinimicrobiota bacterium]